MDLFSVFLSIYLFCLYLIPLPVCTGIQWLAFISTVSIFSYVFLLCFSFAFFILSWLLFIYIFLCRVFFYLFSPLFLCSRFSSHLFFNFPSFYLFLDCVFIFCSSVILFCFYISLSMSVFLYLLFCYFILESFSDFLQKFSASVGFNLT